MILPLALAQHEVPEARHVARREAHLVLRKPGLRQVVHLRLTPAIEVLHAEWTCEIALERVVDVLPRQRFERGAGGVEVPVLVLEVRARAERPTPGRERRDSSLPDGR